MLTSALAFVLGARWRGLWFGIALSIILNGSQPFIFLSQVNRFYSMPLLLLTVALAAICIPRGGAVMAIATGLLAGVTVLSHNITVAVFILAFLAALPACALGRTSSRVLLRSGVAAVVSLLLYGFHIRPLLQGWNSTGNPTPVLVSFVAHAGVPALALAFLGSWLVLVRRDDKTLMGWWLLMFAGSLCVFQLADISWNPRYFLFFMPPMWILAAYAAASVRGRRLPSGTAASSGCFSQIC